MKDPSMESQKSTSRTYLLNLMLLKAWRERWTDSQWGINIKTVLPRGVSGDVYNLADCILQQAVIGPNANQLILSYLRHSLCAHLISHAAVLKRISKFEDFDRIHCVTALVNFLDSIMNGVTCRSKPEESVLPNAMISLVYWLLQIFSATLESCDINTQLNSEQEELLEKTAEVIEKIVKNDFLLGAIYIGKQEDTEFYNKITGKYSEVKNNLVNSGYIPKNIHLNDHFHMLAYLDVDNLQMLKLHSKEVERITYCIQPLLTVEILLNPVSDTKMYVEELLMIQRLKQYSLARLFYELMRAGFISLSNADSIHEIMWGAFTFVQIPHILKQLYTISGNNNESLDHIPEAVEAIEMLLEDVVLSYAKCDSNTLEFLLNNLSNQHLINERHIKPFLSKRDNLPSALSKREVNNQSASIINYIKNVEVSLSGVMNTLKQTILNTEAQKLSADYNEKQEAALKILTQVASGNTFELILSVATVEGQLKTFVSRLIKCNESSKRIQGEIGKAALIRSTLFDVSFLMLTYIVQTYGSEVVLQENGDSFFEKWVREFMIERKKPKSPRNMVQICDENLVTELLMTLTKHDAQLKDSPLPWQDICLNIPGVMYHVLIAWENDTLSTTDVKGILDNIKRGLFCYSVCASSYLCAYIQTVREEEHLKPLNMVNQFLLSLNPEEMSSQENIKEPLGLMMQIIRRMQYDVHPVGNTKSRSIAGTKVLISNAPLEEQFREVWKGISERGWLPIKSTQILNSLQQAGGSTWLVQKLVNEILSCPYTRDMMKTMDIVFAIMHLDIEKNTVALLDNVIPMTIFGRHHDNISESQSAAIVRLCVYCIISSLEMSVLANNSSMTALISASKKRPRPSESDDLDGAAMASGNASKIQKLNPENSNDSCSSDFIGGNVGSSTVPETGINPATGNDSVVIKINESLQTSLQNLFKTFAYFVVSDELTPRIYFIFQFISLLVECGGDRIRPILKLIPNTLIQNLLKVMVTDDITIGLISRLYDLRSEKGRQSAISDLCLLRNIYLRKESIKL